MSHHYCNYLSCSHLFLGLLMLCRAREIFLVKNFYGRSFINKNEAHLLSDLFWLGEDYHGFPVAGKAQVGRTSSRDQHGRY